MYVQNKFFKLIILFLAYLKILKTKFKYTLLLKNLLFTFLSPSYLKITKYLIFHCNEKYLFKTVDVFVSHRKNQCRK